MNPGIWRKATLASIAALISVIFATAALAYPDYNGCKDCHGGFEEDNYVSKSDGADWNESLMDGHETFVGDECDACHKDGSKGEVYLNFSKDSALSKSCVGCHGREEDVNGSCSPVGGGIEVECGSGTGLRRMHEINVGAGTCQGCHAGDPAPVGEQANPFNYGLNGVQMMDACDDDSSESRYGANGLDNDGDGQIDDADSDCQAVNSPPTQPGTLSATAVTTSSATVQWIASTDIDGDTITYQVDYRRNGDTPWSNGGSTTSSSQPLSGLDDGQSYDVRITPNDSFEDGASRTTLNLFATEKINTPPTQPGTLSATAVTTSSATVQWIASTDIDGDTITYQVDYRRNGDTPWSNGGSTTSISQPLSGLDDGQSYDVRITPNDGFEDGTSRTTLNLFTTQFVSDAIFKDGFESN